MAIAIVVLAVVNADIIVLLAVLIVIPTVVFLKVDVVVFFSISKPVNNYSIIL